MIYDIRKEAMDDPIRFGAKAASSPKEVAQVADIILTSLPSPEALEDVVLGKHGVLEGARSGKLTEAFGSGTAAIISPVGSIHYAGDEHAIGSGKVGEISQKLYDTILDMQYGHVPAPDRTAEGLSARALMEDPSRQSLRQELSA